MEFWVQYIGRAVDITKRMMNDSEFRKLGERIGANFNDIEILKSAFVHRSYLNENKSAGLRSNERLEFLGDAVLELVVTDFLYKKYTDKPEGELTAIRSALVKGKTLSEVSSSLGFGEFLLLSEGEKEGSDKAKSLILANCMEAVIGALYLDSGIKDVKSFIENHIIKNNLDNILEKKLYIDPKSEYQEVIQEKYKETPKYELISEDGPDHDKKFVCGVRVGGKIVAKGSGRSKNSAEQDAAKNALLGLA